MASASGVPTNSCASLSWLPPVMNTPVALSMAFTSPASAAAGREGGSTVTTSAAPNRWKMAVYVATAFSGNDDAVGMTTILALLPPASRKKRRRTVERPTLSSAPPMMSRDVRTVVAIATA